VTQPGFDWNPRTLTEVSTKGGFTLLNISQSEVAEIITPFAYFSCQPSNAALRETFPIAQFEILYIISIDCTSRSLFD
jgi:hypothetical protein